VEGKEGGGKEGGREIGVRGSRCRRRDSNGRLKTAKGRREEGGGRREEGGGRRKEEGGRRERSSWWSEEITWSLTFSLSLSPSFSPRSDSYVIVTWAFSEDWIWFGVGIGLLVSPPSLLPLLSSLLPPFLLPHPSRIHLFLSSQKSASVLSLSHSLSPYILNILIISFQCIVSSLPPPPLPCFSTTNISLDDSEYYWNSVFLER